jgi:hypothetical protein
VYNNDSRAWNKKADGRKEPDPRAHRTVVSKRHEAERQMAEYSKELSDCERRYALAAEACSP